MTVIPRKNWKKWPCKTFGGKQDALWYMWNGEWENCCKLINLIVTTTSCTPSSNSLPSLEQPSGLNSFPRRVQAYQFRCGRSFVLSNSPRSPEHRLSFLIPQNTAGWSTKLFPFLNMSTNFFISPSLFVTLQRKQKCDERNRVVYFNAWCTAISKL